MVQVLTGHSQLKLYHYEQETKELFKNSGQERFEGRIVEAGSFNENKSTTVREVQQWGMTLEKDPVKLNYRPPIKSIFYIFRHKIKIKKYFNIFNRIYFMLTFLVIRGHRSVLTV